MPRNATVQSTIDLDTLSALDGGESPSVGISKDRQRQSARTLRNLPAATETDAHGPLATESSSGQPWHGRVSTLELCAGAGGEALGLERAGIEHAGLVEQDAHACATLRLNRPRWNVIEADLTTFDARPFKGVAMVSGGLPCPPYSIAGRQLGAEDPRDLLGHGLRIVDEVRPQAVMFENVKGLLQPRFKEVLDLVRATLGALGYAVDHRILNACAFGVPQSRSRLILVALRPSAMERFLWPECGKITAPSVGTALVDLMGAGGWAGAAEWAKAAGDVAPTLVGGSKNHGGPDLGPTRARLAWRKLGIDGRSVAADPPGAGFNGVPKLTVRMAARLQGFPDVWRFSGTRTASYRQIANALPPAVAQAVAGCVLAALRAD